LQHPPGCLHNFLLSHREPHPTSQRAFCDRPSSPPWLAAFFEALGPGGRVRIDPQSKPTMGCKNCASRRDGGFEITGPSGIAAERAPARYEKIALATKLFGPLRCGQWEGTSLSQPEEFSEQGQGVPCSAEEGNRTPMSVSSVDFESTASASFATSAAGARTYHNESEMPPSTKLLREHRATRPSNSRVPHGRTAYSERPRGMPKSRTGLTSSSPPSTRYRSTRARHGNGRGSSRSFAGPACPDGRSRRPRACPEPAWNRT